MPSPSVSIRSGFVPSSISRLSESPSASVSAYSGSDRQNWPYIDDGILLFYLVKEIHDAKYNV